MFTKLGTYDEQKNAVLAALSAGRVAPIMPEGWLAAFKALLIYTNIPPAVAAEHIGVPYSAILNYLKINKDAELQELINLSLNAHFQYKLQNPSEEDRKGFQVLQLGVKTLTTLLDKENNAMPMELSELEKIKEARERFVIELNISDDRKAKEIEANKLAQSITTDVEVDV